MNDKEFRGYLIFIAIMLVVVAGGKTVEHYYIDPAIAQMQADGYGNQ